MDFTPEEIAMTTAQVACHTEGCPSAGDSMEATVAVDANESTVLCGWCGQEITDVVRSSP